MTTLSFGWHFVAWILAVIVKEGNGYIEHEIRLIGHPTDQNSIYVPRGGEPELAVDGNTDTNYFGSYSCAHNEKSEPNPWWSVDLKHTEYVTKVQVLNRGDCCTERLYDMVVYLSDEPFRNNPTTKTCGSHAPVVAASTWVTIDCAEPTAGRYLTILLTGDERILTYCEVKAFARYSHVLSRVASASGNDLPTIRSQIEEDMILPSLTTALGNKYVSLDVNEKALFKSPIMDCAWDRITRIRMSLYNSGAEVMYVNLDTSGSSDTRSNFYTYENLHSSSFTDLSTSYYQNDCHGRAGAFFSVLGQGKRVGAEHSRSLYINCFYEGCSGDTGWFVFFDTDHGNLCTWENNLGTNPVFKYSGGLEMSQASGWPQAEVFTFTADLDNSLPGAISDCNMVPDGVYQSAIACSVYVQCSSGSLSYKLCPAGKYFDKDAANCVAESTTCTDTTKPSATCVPDGCSPNPCKNSAACLSDGDGWTCTCKAGYTGEACDTDACTSGGLCKNDATCTRNSVDSYTCNCAEGYDGTHCDNRNECHGQTCSGQGECTDGTDDYTCACNTGFTGKDCNVNIDDCENINCNEGQCVDGVNEYSCSCSPGFTGEFCTDNINECSPDPCVNGACSDGINEYTCTCEPGYEGTNCDVNINECEGKTCSNHGTCQDGVNQYTCQCQDGYTGTDCETDIDECEGANCNNGQCVDGVNGYSCSCDAGYSGDDCSIDIDECASDPCKNGGHCSHGVDEFTCQCEAEYTGTTCEIERICSKANPCVHGSCTNVGDEGTGYSCTCNSGYINTNCDVVDPCQANTELCKNGGGCKLNGNAGAYYCLCQGGYLPPHCDRVDPCYDIPCKNGGTCQRVDTDGVVTANCECLDGFGGDTCESGPCETQSPCTSGICVNNHELDNKYQCVDCPDDTALGSAGAQEGATEAGSSEGGSFSPMLMYGLIAAVAVAVLLALIGIFIAGKKRRSAGADGENQAKNEAWSKEMEESQIEKKKSETQRAIEQKAAKRQAVAKTFEKDLYCDF